MMLRIEGNGRKILVVDDDLAIRVLLDTVLKRMGFSVMVAEDGATALDLLERHNYDLMLLDLSMPRVDGYEVLERLPSHNRMPVVVFTAAPDGHELPEAGVCTSIRKPFDLDTFLETIRDCLSQASPSDSSRSEGED